MRRIAWMAPLMAGMLACGGSSGGDPGCSVLDTSAPWPKAYHDPQNTSNVGVVP